MSLHQEFVKALVAKDYPKLIELIQLKPRLLMQSVNETCPTPLHFYLDKDPIDIEAINFLLSLGADPNYCPVEKISAAELAAAKEFDDIYVLFTEHQTARVTVKRKLISQIKCRAGSILEQAESSSDTHKALRTCIKDLTDISDEVPVDDLLDRLILINSFEEALVATNEDDRRRAIQAVLNARAVLVRSTSGDYQLYNTGVNKILTKFCERVFPDTPPLSILLNSALIKTVEIDGVATQKSWVDCYSYENTLTEVFLRDYDDNIHLLSSVVERAIANLSQGDYLLKSIWKKTDLRGVTSEALDLELMQTYAELTPHLQELYEYSNYVYQEKSKSVVLNKLTALCDGLLAGSSNTAGSGGTETVAGSDANVSVSEFMAWWNEFSERNQALAVKLLAIKSRAGTSLAEILEPLISPREYLSRFDTVFCVDTIGRNLKDYLACHIVKSEQQQLLGIRLKERSQANLRQLNETIQEELESIAPSSLQHLRERLEKSIIPNLFFTQLLLQLEKLSFKLTYSQLEAYRALLSKPSLSVQRPVNQLCLLADKDERYNSAHLIEESKPSLREMKQAVHGSPELVALYANSQLVDEDRVYASSSYLVKKYYLLATKKRPISQNLLKQTLTMAVDNSDMDFIPYLLDIGLSSQCKVTFQDTRFNHIGIGNDFYVSLPMLPRNSLIKGRVISRQGAVIRLRFSGRYFYHQPVDGYMHRLYVELDDGDDREYNLNDKASRRELNYQEVPHDVTSYQPLIPPIITDSLLGFSMVTGNISLFKRLLVSAKLTEVIDRLLTIDGELLCDLGVLIELVRALVSHPDKEAITPKEIERILIAILASERHDLCLPMIKAGLVNPVKTKFNLRVNGRLIKKRNLVDYTFAAKREDFFNCLLESVHFSNALVNHDAWHDSNVPYTWVKRYSEKLKTTDKDVSHPEITKNLLCRAVQSSDEMKLNTIQNLLIASPSFDGRWVLEKLYLADGLEKAIELYLKLPERFNGSEIFSWLFKESEQQELRLLEPFFEHMSGSSEKLDQALLCLYLTKVAKPAVREKHLAFLEAQISNRYLTTLYDYSICNNDSQCFDLALSDSTASERENLFIRLKRADITKQLSLTPILLKHGVNLWLHIDSLDRKVIKELLNANESFKKSFFDRFLSIYQALYDGRNFKLFRAQHHWRHQSLTVESLFKHLSEKPNSLSASAFDILLKKARHYENITQGSELDKTADKLSLFLEVHQLSKRLSFFASTKITSKSSWYDVQSHIKRDLSSRSAKICQALNLG